MSANDAIVLKENFAEWKRHREAPTSVDAWLYYGIEQFVKQYSLDDEEVIYGITDGGNDGGVDAIYLLANQRQLVTEESQLDSKNVSKIKVLIFQSKTSGGFKPTEVEKWLEFTGDFFDLSKPADRFGVRYNDKVVRIMRTWKQKYVKISSGFPDVSVDYLYITGDDVEPDSYVIDSGDRVKRRLAKHLPKAVCNINYVGAKELWEQVQRRPPKVKTLVWAETPMQTVEGTVGLVRLRHFFQFIQDEPGVLAERIFESNVRGYKPESNVNSEIQSSLQNSNGPNFWLLNNGVTIISPNATPASHLHLNITDPQIVNGLQTSREIFSYFIENNVSEQDTRTIMVRVIQTDNALLQDTIIRATNSQNRMTASSLRMTDQIHRDIEEYFKKYDLYYDRRKGFYKDQEKPIQKIVSANDVVQAVVSIILQKPNDARARPGDYFKDDSSYEKVFGEKAMTLEAYAACVELVRRIDRHFEGSRIEGSVRRNLKFYLAAFLAREITNMRRPVAAKLPKFTAVSSLDDKKIETCLKKIKRIFDPLMRSTDADTVARGPELLKRLDAQYTRNSKKKPTKRE